MPIKLLRKGFNSPGEAHKKSFQSKQDLIDENEKLQQQIADLTEQNNALILDQADLESLRELYELDQEYADYPKIAAQVISCLLYTSDAADE